MSEIFAAVVDGEGGAARQDAIHQDGKGEWRPDLGVSETAVVIGGLIREIGGGEPVAPQDVMYWLEGHGISFPRGVLDQLRRVVSGSRFTRPNGAPLWEVSGSIPFGEPLQGQGGVDMTLTMHRARTPVDPGSLDLDNRQVVELLLPLQDIAGTPIDLSKIAPPERGRGHQVYPDLARHFAECVARNGDADDVLRTIQGLTMLQTAELAGLLCLMAPAAIASTKGARGMDIEKRAQRMLRYFAGQDDATVAATTGITRQDRSRAAWSVRDVRGVAVGSLGEEVDTLAQLLSLYENRESLVVHYPGGRARYAPEALAIIAALREQKRSVGRAMDAYNTVVTKIADIQLEQGMSAERVRAQVKVLLLRMAGFSDDQLQGELGVGEESLLTLYEEISDSLDARAVRDVGGAELCRAVRLELLGNGSLPDTFGRARSVTRSADPEAERIMRMPGAQRRVASWAARACIDIGVIRLLLQEDRLPKQPDYKGVIEQTLGLHEDGGVPQQIQEIADHYGVRRTVVQKQIDHAAQMLAHPALAGLVLTDWRSGAACREDETFYSGRYWAGADVEAKLTVCQTCPVAEQCDSLAQALRPVSGIWGGRRWAKGEIRVSGVEEPVAPLLSPQQASDLKDYLTYYRAGPDASTPELSEPVRSAVIKNLARLDPGEARYMALLLGIGDPKIGALFHLQGVKLSDYPDPLQYVADTVDAALQPILDKLTNGVVAEDA